ncbi:beta-glucosidase [Thalassococcus sp. CAU 1522]|uniref:Beta-glucosidase n=1 Tax=Thalassococcus arenae TaxID=2851652 RepID=A0ABS6N3U3_9RHOB|nr:GH1 family beta-glucosidase [Thalassococcus arenae]MBV2358681.1 beta-glucosidase [Thalassococcus arenae]
MTFKRSDLPRDFLFGAATSAYQIEGQSFGGAGPCIWDSYAATPDNVIRNEHGAIACDHYHRFEEDLDLVANGHFDAYRFSTNWSRILPEGRGTVNQEGLDFYDRLVDAQLARGLRPFLTLYHWELPSALQDVGGWTNPDIADWFADYARIVMQRIGDRVSHTATINEPICVSWIGHFIGRHAPGHRDIRDTARAMHHVLKAHGRAVSALRSDGYGDMGIVINVTHYEPVDDSRQAAIANDRADAIFNRWFLQGVFKGSYPDVALEGLGPHMPRGWEADMAEIAQPVDWLGMNYYFRTLTGPADDAWPALQHHDGDLPKTQMGWEISPEGFYKELTRCARDFSGDVPIYVTENGMANADALADGAVEDTIRTRYLDDHIGAVIRAERDGVPLKGYFAWSLLDNYEWAFGYERRFGLVHVDFDTQTRTPKASYRALRAALQRN